MYLDGQRRTPYGTVGRLQSLMSHGAYKEQRMPSWVWKHEDLLVNGMLMVSAAALRDLARSVMARSREALEAVLTEKCVRAPTDKSRGCLGQYGQVLWLGTRTPRPACAVADDVFQ